MGGNIGEHGADDAHVIDAISKVREELADFHAGLAVAAELTLHAENGGLLELRKLELYAAETGGDMLTVECVEDRLGIERFEVRWPAVHKEENDVLRGGGELRVFRGEGVGGSRRGQRGKAETGGEKVPAREVN